LPFRRKENLSLNTEETILDYLLKKVFLIFYEICSMSKIILVLFVLLSRCSSAMNFTMEIFSTVKSGDQSLLSTTSLSENDIKKLTRNNGLKRQTRGYGSPNICESTKESLNNTELKRYLCSKAIFGSIVKPEILKYWSEYRGINRCERNLIIFEGTSQKLRTNCECNREYRLPKCLDGGPHCTHSISKRMCDKLALQWEKIGHPFCNTEHKSENERIKILQECRNGCVNKMTRNPRLECEKIEVKESFHKTKVEFAYKVCKNVKICNDDNDLTKFPFEVHLTDHEICAPTLLI